jgi:hypothetical protein
VITKSKRQGGHCRSIMPVTLDSVYEFRGVAFGEAILRRRALQGVYEREGFVQGMAAGPHYTQKWHGSRAIECECRAGWLSSPNYAVCKRDGGSGY